MESEINLSAEDLISSSGFMEAQEHEHEAAMEEENLEENLEDILDLAGGARDAIERHKSEQNSLDTKTISSSPEEAETPTKPRHTAASQCKSASMHYNNKKYIS